MTGFTIQSFKVRSSISKVNNIIRELYFKKKKLMEETPFEWNISLTLWILWIFVAGQVLFSVENSIISQKGSAQSQAFKYSFGFWMFLGALIMISFANFIYVLRKPYKPFNFDYHVIQTVSKKLMEQNKGYFNLRDFSLVCSIEMTWILLKPKESQSSNENDLQEEDQ